MSKEDTFPENPFPIGHDEFGEVRIHGEKQEVKMSKIYCEDCEKFKMANELYRAEHCDIIGDDYYSPKHPIRRSPSSLNARNDCSFFEIKKSGK